MLQHRWEERYRADGPITIKLLLPRRLAAVASLVDVSACGMAVSAPSAVWRYPAIRVGYDLPDGSRCSAPALVVHRTGDRLGLLLSLSDARARQQHAKLLERCRKAAKNGPPTDDSDHSEPRTSQDAAKVFSPALLYRRRGG